MRFLSYFLIFILLLVLPVFAQTQKPKILLSFPESFFANEEIEVSLSISGLKTFPYDLKISIEKDKKVLSEIYNEKEQKWQSSHYYLKELFLGPNFEGKFRLKLKKQYVNFEGEADLVVKIKESQKQSFLVSSQKIKILKPKIEREEEKNLAGVKTLQEKGQIKSESFFFSTFLFALCLAIFSAIIILVLKNKLKSIKN